MKLGTKIFCWVTIFFSVVFLTGGYTLLSFFYETVMERKVENAAEQYQYNKFILEAALITKGSEWFAGVADGAYDAGGVASDMGHTVAFCRSDQTVLYSEFPDGTDLTGILSETKPDQVHYQFAEIAGRSYCLMAGIVSYGGSQVYLITGSDMERISKQQERLLQKFGAVYLAAIVISIVLIFILSNLLTRPIWRLNVAAKSIAGGNYGERIEIIGKDEVGQLAENFNQMAAAIEDKMTELTDTVRRQEDFVANFSHELKTPLTSIIGYSDRIYQKELSKEEIKKSAWYIWNEGMRLESLSHKMMDMTNLKNGDFIFQETMTDVLLQELVRESDYLLKEKQAEIALTAGYAIIRVEYDLFKTLFLNVIDNSLKAGARHIDISGCIKETGRNGDGGSLSYVIQIADDGVGIPEQELQRITEAFYMVDKARSRKQHGAGLGLALVRQIAELHGGTLEISSQAGQGTKVTLVFELVQEGREVL